MCHYERFSKWQGMRHSWAKTWVSTDDLCEPITKLFNAVARGGFPTLWTINIIQFTFKSGERTTLGNYKLIMLGTIFGKLYGSVLEKVISQWA